MEDLREIMPEWFLIHHDRGNCTGCQWHDYFRHPLIARDAILAFLSCPISCGLCGNKADHVSKHGLPLCSELIDRCAD